MKIEYLKEESQDGPLIRLFDFDEREVRELKVLLDKLVQGDLQSVFPS